MKISRKLTAVFLSFLLALSLASCGQSTEDITETTDDMLTPPATENVVESSEHMTINPRPIAALKGPTAMGLVSLMDQNRDGGSYEFTLAGSADEVTPLLIKGELDMACVPANLAAVLYNKTEGQIVTLAVNTLGVLYIVENGGESVQSIADLSGKTIVAAGKGSTPEFGLRYLLAQNGLDPDTDVTIDWKSEHTECVSALASGAAEIALLPQPFVTAAQAKLENLRTALDLTAEWDALENGSAMITGVIVARKDVAENEPLVMDGFLEEYAASVDWVNEHPADAAALIAEYGIVENPSIAEKALPHCNIVCITGPEMKDKLSGYLEVLFNAAPESVGGALPGEDFYYSA